MERLCNQHSLLKVIYLSLGNADSALQTTIAVKGLISLAWATFESINVGFQSPFLSDNAYGAWKIDACSWYKYMHVLYFISKRSLPTGYKRGCISSAIKKCVFQSHDHISKQLPSLDFFFQAFLRQLKSQRLIPRQNVYSYFTSGINFHNVII